MRFVYVGSFRLPNLDAAAPRVLNVAKALRVAGHAVSFISWGGQYRESDLCPDGKHRVDGFEYVITHELDAEGGFMAKAKSKLTRGNKTKALLKQYVHDIDVVITYNGCLTQWLLRFTKKYQIKLINDITEWFKYAELKCSDWLPYAYNMFCTQKQVKNKIVISSYLDRFYHKTHNIVIPATYDLSEQKWHNKDNITCATKMVGRFDGVALIYAGTPARKDLLHYVINVVQRLNEEQYNIRFLVLGITKEQYLTQYAQISNNVNLHENICFLGRVSQDLIPAYYSISDFLVLLREPNRKSNAGFPTKFSESIASGTPVIANITSDLGLYLKDGETGFVVNEPSEEALYRTIKEKVMIVGKEERSRIRQNVKKISVFLDYHFYIEPLDAFVKELK